MNKLNQIIGAGLVIIGILLFTAFCGYRIYTAGGLETKETINIKIWIQKN